MLKKEKFMKEAIKQAKKAYDKEEIPVGAVIVKDGKIIARGYNKKEEKKVQNIVTIVSVLILIPSVYFAYSLYQEQKFRRLKLHDDYLKYSEKELTAGSINIVLKI